MIHSSALEGHHFLLTRRRGYDPAEVDAVIRRLLDTLRKYEERDAESSESAGEVADLEQARRLRDEAAEDAAALRDRLTADATRAR